MFQLFLGWDLGWNLRPYIEMELIRGLNFREIGQQEGELVHKISSLVKMADVLVDFHSFGNVHRDIKPANFLEDEQGNIYLLDYGLVAPVGHQDGVMVSGTVAYISPEALRLEPLSVSCDIYSLGMSFYDLLAWHPFEHAYDNGQIKEWQVRRMPRPLIEANADVPEKVSDVVMKCLRKEPERRYKSAEYLRDDLAACC